MAFKFFYNMQIGSKKVPKKYRKKRTNKSDVPGSNLRFLSPKSKIICADTDTSHVDMLFCNFIKSFPNFETVLDKITVPRKIIFSY
jgi:hypothetical protein